VILFPEKVGGKFVMMHRPLEWVGPRYGVEHASAWISFADDLMGFRRSRLLITNKYPWETAKLGVNIPPIKTEHGWLTIYHAVGPDKFYRLGALLLDLDDPSIVRTARPTGSCSRRPITRSKASIAASASPAARW
jgi:beta-1,2-mannobiose phosphorylase / 1,2-beta-oligomannan phosphorylase